VENAKYEEKVINVEENYRRRFEDMNKAFEANLITLPSNGDNNANFNNTQHSWRT